MAICDLPARIPAMKPMAWILAFSAVAFASPAIAASPAPGAPEVVGLALTRLEVPDRISAVMWTRRERDFTLQIMRRTAEERDRLQATSRTAPAAAVTPAMEAPQVWLLRDDGTHIPPTRRWETPEPVKKACTGRSPTRCLGYEILYSYPHSAGEQAVAVALRFGDVFLIEKLPALLK
jgi:hypothetical protein